jgi:integrase
MAALFLEATLPAHLIPVSAKQTDLHGIIVSFEFCCRPTIFHLRWLHSGYTAEDQYMPKLTKLGVDAAFPDPNKGQTLFYDEALKGFGLRITRRGVKSFFVEYRTKSSSRRRHTVGRYGVLTPDQARKEAKKLLAEVTQGRDPAADKKAKKAEMRVAELLDRFIQGHVIPNNKPSTRHEEERILNRLIRPQLGTLRLAGLTTVRVKSWHSSLVGTPPSANRALGHLQRACRFAIEHGFMTSNPCHGITRFKEKIKDRFFADAELTRIGQAIRDLEASGAILPSAALGIRLIAFTGLRATEARLLRWEDFDITREVLHLADAKAGPRSVPLFSQTVDLLKNASRIGPFIVAGFDPMKPLAPRSFATAFERVLGRAQITDASLHTLRHTLATYMAQHGDSVPMIAAAGGWRTLEMVQRYVSMHSVGKVHPLPAGQRIAIALHGDPEIVAQLPKAV